MTQYILKSALVGELEKRIKTNKECMIGLRNLDYYQGKVDALNDTISSLNTLEVKDPYEQCVQYPSVKDGIQAYAETYSFNIESLLFNQLTKEQQKLWRKEIEQACISGGEAGVELARDIRYKENLEVKEVQEEPVSNPIDFEKELYKAFGQVKDFTLGMRIAKWFYDMGKNSRETVSEELEDYINELSKQFPEVSFAKLSRIAVRVAKWQKEKMMTKAVDGKVIANGMGNPILHLWEKGRHLIDKKVKVIIIKED